MPTEFPFYSWCPGCGLHRHRTLLAAKRNALRMERAMAKAINGPAPRAKWGTAVELLAELAP